MNTQNANKRITVSEIAVDENLRITTELEIIGTSIVRVHQKRAQAAPLRIELDHVQLTQHEWEAIGKAAGWLK